MSGFLMFMLKYFWFVAILNGFVNYFIFKSRIPKSVTEITNEKEELNKLLKSVLIFLTVPFALLGILQILGGYQNLFFIFSRNYENPYLLLSWITIFTYWAVTLYWVFFKKGAETLVKYKEIFFRQTILNLDNEIIIKLLFILMVVGGITGMIVGINNDLYSQDIFINK